MDRLYANKELQTRWRAVWERLLPYGDDGRICMPEDFKLYVYPGIPEDTPERLITMLADSDLLEQALPQLLWSGPYQEVPLDQLMPLGLLYTLIVVPASVHCRAAMDPTYNAWTASPDVTSRFEPGLGITSYDTCMAYCSELLRLYTKDLIHDGLPPIWGCVYSPPPTTPTHGYRLRVNDFEILDRSVRQMVYIIERRAPQIERTRAAQQLMHLHRNRMHGFFPGI
jgi:hypothetical protein